MTELAFAKKLGVSAILGFVTLTAAFGSSIFSSALTAVTAEFGFSREVGVLGVSLYVLGMLRSVSIPTANTFRVCDRANCMGTTV